jgi:hypothetical protein
MKDPETDPRPYQPPEFDCIGCGRHIIAIGLIDPPENRLCAGCSLIGPERNKAVHDWQDGDICEAEFKRIYENAPTPPGLSIDPANRHRPVSRHEPQ